MEEVVFDPITKSPPVWCAVLDFEIVIHTSKKNGKKLGKASFAYDSSYIGLKYVHMWLCFEDEYSGYAVTMGQEKWGQISKDEYPISVEEFVDAIFESPVRVLLDMNGKYPDLIEVESEPKEKNYYDPGEEIPVLNESDFDDEIPF